MKRMMMILFVAVMVFGVWSSAAQGKAATKNEFDQTSATLAQMAREKQPPVEVMAWLKTRISQFSQVQRDALVNEVIDYQKHRIDDYEKEFDSCDTDREKVIDSRYRPPSLDNYNRILGIRDEKLRKTLGRLRMNGYRIQYSEDSLYLELDFRLALNTFLAEISDKFKEFLEIQARESEDKSYDDLGRVIGYDELASRLEAVSEFQARYPKSVYTRRVKIYEALYLWLYFGYAINTPVFEQREGSQSMVISPLAKSSYENADLLMESSTFGKMMKDLIALLEGSGGRKTPAIEKFMDDRTALGRWLMENGFCSGDRWWNLSEDLIDEWGRGRAKE